MFCFICSYCTLVFYFFYLFFHLFTFVLAFIQGMFLKEVSVLGSEVSLLTILLWNSVYASLGISILEMKTQIMNKWFSKILFYIILCWHLESFNQAVFPISILMSQMDLGLAGHTVFQSRKASGCWVFICFSLQLFP